MTGTYREIDTTVWKRAVHREVFRAAGSRNIASVWSWTSPIF